MSTSMLTLFSSITGGVNWADCLEPLTQISEGLQWIFIAYISFTYFAVLNVITGVFCNSAIENAQRDPDLVVHTTLASKQRYTKKLEKIFKALDFDSSSGITLVELESLMQNEKLIAFFEAMDLEACDAWALFKLIDTDGTQVIDVDEFVQGCLRLKGSAKSLDFATMLSESRWLRKSMT